MVLSFDISEVVIVAIFTINKGNTGNTLYSVGYGWFYLLFELYLNLYETYTPANAYVARMKGTSMNSCKTIKMILIYRMKIQIKFNRNSNLN